MNRNDLDTINDIRRARMIRELHSNLADLVESGDITADEANEWANDKADQWRGDHE